MRNYTTTDGYSETVDLDDLSIYPQEIKEMNVHDLFSRCMSKAGESLFYMKHLHKEFGSTGQESRVEKLCEELAFIWHKIRKFAPNAYKCTLANEEEYRMALMSWLYRFEDEVENQC